MVSFDNDSLRVAVKLWVDDKKAALGHYGDISEWNNSEVTDMSALFQEGRRSMTAQVHGTCRK